ncbi:MAG TPA: hypothetical protein VII57_05850 [Dehalococcoidia bacterium]
MRAAFSFILTAGLLTLLALASALGQSPDRGGWAAFEGALEDELRDDQTPRSADVQEGWLTYRNDLYDYEVSYPAEWQIEVGERLVDDRGTFETQRVRLRRGSSSAGPFVSVYVNFQGDWCEGIGRRIVEDVFVAGNGGRYYECFADTCPNPPEPVCRPDPYRIVLFLEGARGRLNYTVFGEARDDAATVRRIVESFRFID